MGGKDESELCKGERRWGFTVVIISAAGGPVGGRGTVADSHPGEAVYIECQAAGWARLALVQT